MVPLITKGVNYITKLLSKKSGKKVIDNKLSKTAPVKNKNRQKETKTKDKNPYLKTEKEKQAERQQHKKESEEAKKILEERGKSDQSKADLKYRDDWEKSSPDIKNSEATEKAREGTVKQYKEVSEKMNVVREDVPEAKFVEKIKEKAVNEDVIKGQSQNIELGRGQNAPTANTPLRGTDETIKKIIEGKEDLEALSKATKEGGAKKIEKMGWAKWLSKDENKAIIPPVVGAIIGKEALSKESEAKEKESATENKNEVQNDINIEKDSFKQTIDNVNEKQVIAPEQEINHLGNISETELEKINDAANLFKEDKNPVFQNEDRELLEEIPTGAELEKIRELQDRMEIFQPYYEEPEPKLYKDAIIEMGEPSLDGDGDGGEGGDGGGDGGGAGGGE